MKVTVDLTTIGDEIKAAILSRSKKAANEWNIKKAEKYLRYCKKTGDKVLIAYAERNLIREKNKVGVNL